jgi:hypothetical protein
LGEILRGFPFPIVTGFAEVYPGLEIGAFLGAGLGLHAASPTRRTDCAFMLDIGVFSALYHFS